MSSKFDGPLVSAFESDTTGVVKQELVTYRVKDGILNVHGHIHTNACPPGPYKCVSVEQINFTPLDVEEINVG